MATEGSSRRVNVIAMETPTTEAFQSGMLDLERRMTGQSSLHRPSQVHMSGKKLLKALSAFTCISGKGSALSKASSGRHRRPIDLQDSSGESKRRSDPRILLRIVMWGGPNTLLLLTPFDAPAESVVEMVLDSYVNGVGINECKSYELYCAHCNAPALHPKQPIGSVGSRHFLLCKKVPGALGSNLFRNGSNSSTHTHTSSRHSHSRQHNTQLSGSTHSPRSKSLRSLSHSSSTSSSLSHHRRCQTWWNPVKCLSVGGQH